MIQATMDIASYPTARLLKMVSELLEAILQSNQRMTNERVTHFHSKTIPNISILAYLTRIHRFVPFENEALLSILIYFDRLTELDPDFYLDAYNIHRLLITSVVVAAKFTSDVFYANSRYAKVGGLPLPELNQLETRFLFLLDFRLHVTLHDLQAYADQLLSHCDPTLPHSLLPTASHASSFAFHKTPSVRLPLTPPYTHLPTHYHPYSRPKKLGFMSPQD